MAHGSKGGPERPRRDRDVPVRGSQVLPYDFTGRARDGGPCASARELGDGRWSLRVFTADAPSRGDYVLVMTGDASYTPFRLSSDAVRVAEDDGASWRAFATVDLDECASWPSGPPPVPLDLPRSRSAGPVPVARRNSGRVFPKRVDGSRLHRREMTVEQQSYVALLAGVLGVFMPFFAPLGWWMGARARKALGADASRGSVFAARWGWVLGLGVSCFVGFIAVVWLLLSLAVAGA